MRIRLWSRRSREGLPVKVLLDLMWCWTKRICAQTHVYIHMCFVIWLIPKQPRLRHWRRRHWASIGEGHHARRELYIGKAKRSLVEKRFCCGHLIRCPVYHGGWSGKLVPSTLLQPPSRIGISRRRGRLHVRKVHSDRTGSTQVTCCRVRSSPAHQT